MELFQEILCHVLANGNVHVSFSRLTHDDIAEIVTSECYQALRKMKAVLGDDSLDDSECFQWIEEIVCAFESLGSASSRHDFG